MLRPHPRHLQSRFGVRAAANAWAAFAAMAASVTLHAGSAFPDLSVYVESTMAHALTAEQGSVIQAGTPPTLWGIDEYDGQLWRIDDYRRPTQTFADYGELYFGNPYRHGQPEPLVPDDDIGRLSAKTGAKCLTIDANGLAWFVIARPIEDDYGLIHPGPHLARMETRNLSPRGPYRSADNVAFVVGDIGLELDADSYISGLATHPVVGSYLIATVRTPGQRSQFVIIDKASGERVAGPLPFGREGSAAEDIAVDSAGRVLVSDTSVNQLVSIQPGKRREARFETIDVDQSAGLEQMADASPMGMSMGIGSVVGGRGGGVSIRALAVVPTEKGQAVGFDTTTGRMVVQTLGHGGNQFLPPIASLTHVEGMAFEHIPHQGFDAALPLNQQVLLPPLHAFGTENPRRALPPPQRFVIPNGAGVAVRPAPRGPFDRVSPLFLDRSIFDIRSNQPRDRKPTPNPFDPPGEDLDPLDSREPELVPAPMAAAGVIMLASLAMRRRRLSMSF